MTTRKVFSLVFVREESQILLGYKKRGFGKGRWNGFGGKVEHGETILDGALRELEEESGLVATALSKIGLLEFEFRGEPMLHEVHVFLSSTADGQPRESDDRELLDNWLFVINVKHDPRHGPDSTDFKGNECRKIIRSTDQLKMLIAEIYLQEPRVSRRISQSSSSTISKLDLVRKYQLIRLLIKCMISFSKVVSSTMRPSLNPQWSQIIDQFANDFDAFSPLFLQSFPRHSGSELTTPKIRVLTHEMCQCIYSNNCSLSRVSEQPFETIHKSFLNFSSRYSIPNTGIENKRPSQSSCSSAKVHTPSLGTRQSKSKLPAKSKPARKLQSIPQPHQWPVLPSQVSLKRASLKELQNKRPTKSSQDSSESSDAPTRYVGNIKYARERRLRAVIGYNQSHLPLNPEAINRMRIAFKMFTDRSRGGDDLRIDGCAPWNPGPPALAVCCLSILNSYCQLCVTPD